MKASARASICTGVVVVGLIAVGAPVSPALGSGITADESAGKPLVLDTQPGTSSQAVVRSSSIPAEALAGIRSCRVLLAPRHAKGCIREVIAEANRYCKRLDSRRSRDRCLRGVRRVARNNA